MAEALKLQWDRELLMVPIPIRKGVQGHRIFLIHRDHAALLRDATTLQDLKALSTGSGHQWSTRLTLTSAGFNVVAGASYDGLFGMLMAKRFVTFGRGINEAYREREFHLLEYPDIVVDENILLSMPLPTFFFVTPQRPLLAERIEWGMRHLMRSGEFDRFFYEYHCADLVRAKLHQRRHFQISNPLISQEKANHYRPYFLELDKSFEDVCRDYSTH